MMIGTMPEEKRPGACVGCISCEAVCPQQIKISETLADFVANVSKEQDLGKMGSIFLGGSSDACYFTIAGVPSICAMGVTGEFNHSAKEYALVESLYTRTKVLACAVLDIKKFAER